MNKKAIVFAVAAACLTSGAAFAQSYDYRSDRNDGDQRSTRYEQRQDTTARYDQRQDTNARYDQRYDRHDRYDRNDRYDRHDRHDRYDGERRDYSRHDGYERNDWRANDYRTTAYGAYGAYGGQQRYQMQRGERLSQYNRGDYYVVNDWRSRRLYEPQRGYQWVQSGNDYALVAIATGIIASVLLNH